MKTLGTILVLYCSTICLIYAAELTHDKMELVLTLSHQFHIKCVYLQYTDGNEFEEMPLYSKASQFLSRQWILSVTTSNTMTARHGILHVLLPRGQSKPSLQQITSDPGMSAAVWLIFLDPEVKLPEFFAGVYIPFDCEFLVAQPNGGRMILTEVYRICSNCPLQTYRFGEWTLKEFVRTNVSFYHRRNDLQGLTLVGAVKLGPAVTVEEETDGEIKVIGGFIGSLWGDLMRLMNFTTKYVKAADNAFGVKVNGSWTGMLGMIDRGEIDVISTDILMNKPRMDIVNFLDPLFEVRAYMFTKNPESQGMDWKNFLKPFSTKLWFSILGTMLILAVVLYWTVVNTMDIYSKQGGDTLHIDFTIYDCLFNIFYCFCQQGQSWWRLLSNSSRILLVISYITTLVLTVGYSGFLISYLAFRTNQLPFTTFLQFLQEGTYELGVLYHSIHYTYFKESADKVMKEVFQKHIYPNRDTHPKSFLEGLQRVCSRNHYTFMAPVFIASSFIKQLECTVIPVPGAFFPATATVAIKKNSPYQGLLSYYLKKMRYTGVLSKLRTSFLSMRLSKIHTVHHAAEMEEFQPLLLFLAIGIGLAIAILVVEIIVHRIFAARSFGISQTNVRFYRTQSKVLYIGQHKKGESDN